MPSIGFGLERLGLAAVRRPVAALLLAVLFSAICSIGLTRIETARTLSELFRAETPEFAAFERLSTHFANSEFDMLLAVEGRDLMRREALTTLRNLHAKLNAVAATDGVLSIFDVQRPGQGRSPPAPVLPKQLPLGPAFDALIASVLANPSIKDRLLSVPGGGDQITLFVISLKPETTREKGLPATVRGIETTARQAIAGSGLRFGITGTPVMQAEIDEAMLRDRMIFNGAGFLVGLLINLAFFRRIKYVVIASICPALSVLWAMGLVGWLDLKLNVFINVIPPLVMVITFTDAMHMLYAVRRRLRAGDDRFEAARRAVLDVGPACVLTSLTTSLAFLSLTLTDSALIESFGFAAAIATLLAFLAVVIVLPALVVLLFARESEAHPATARSHRSLDGLERLCGRLAGMLELRHWSIALSGALIVAAFTALHFQLEPRFRLSDDVPDRAQSLMAAERIDAKLGGAFPLQVMVAWPEGLELTSPKVREAIAATHMLLRENETIGNVWSAETLRSWITDGEDPQAQAIKTYFDGLPKQLLRRFANTENRVALVTGRLPDLGTDGIGPVLTAVERELDGLRQRFEGFDFTVTGLPALSARQSTGIIGQLNQSLLAAIGVVTLLIGLAFRSAGAALLSIPPNIFPIVAAGTFIYATGGGLEYASILALTVAFGIAVDDTIHYFNRLRSEVGRTRSVERGISGAVTHVGPVLILTSMVLVAGLAVTLLSALPTLRLFGLLFIVTLAAALLADLIILPALVHIVQRLRIRFTRPVPLTDTALRATVLSHVIYVPTDWGVEVPITYRRSGRMSGQLEAFEVNAASGRAQTDTGSWWISGDRLFQRWDHWLDGRTHEYVLARKDDILYWVRSDGRRGTARLEGS